MSSLLSVENLSLKDLSTGNEILKNISFQLNEKEILGVFPAAGHQVYLSRPVEGASGGASENTFQNRLPLGQIRRPGEAV